MPHCSPACGSLEDLQRVLTDRHVAGIPLLVLGGGSNVLFTQDFDGLVLKIEIPGMQRDDDGVRWLVKVGAGENWHDIVERLMDEDVPGLENLALIPGSMGAAPIQNIGAYGVELAERFDRLQAWDWELKRCRRSLQKNAVSDTATACSSVRTNRD